MGWAERLNPRSDWNLRNARRIIAENAKWEEDRARAEAVNQAVSRGQRIIDWLFGGATT